jgi:hypothetical protein
MAAIIAAKSTFRSRTFSTPTGVSTQVPAQRKMSVIEMFRQLRQHSGGGGPYNFLLADDAEASA